MKYKAMDIVEKKVRHRSYNARLIPEKLAELARAGTYFDSRLLN